MQIRIKPELVSSNEGFDFVGRPNSSKAVHSKVNDSCPTIEPGITLSKFIERNPVGLFGVLVKGHILTVRNGKIYDIASNNGNVRVCGYFVF